MFTSGNGDRSGVPNIGVVITDGRSNSATLTASEAANARNAGITLFAIGIGSNIPETELNAIATDPDSDHVFMVSGFSALSSIMSSFQAQACPAGRWLCVPPPPPPPSSSSSSSSSPQQLLYGYCLRDSASHSC